ncbi:energy-coupling factor ABC transporter ATP-binding protein [Romboutsia sp.]|uniref:energy-coupling factor ABC transporter ATP-binding protein n=1 Tax=Romboutsia sp. TaxID=1965302 RepID=UPI003F351DA5
MEQNIIEFKDLQYRYPDGNEALRGIDISINSGESIALVGANGAGKSTILMQLTGILLPSKGGIYIKDTLIDKKSLPQIRKKLGYVFQNPEDQLFMTSVYDDVAFGPRNYKLSENQVNEKVMIALKKVGIENLSNRASHRLSGGQKHLVAIATALSMEPSILIMDEPTAALDPKARRRVINLLNSFNHTKIIATHDLDMVLDTCERTIVIKDGRIAFDGDSKDILTNEELMNECGLELPLSIQGTRKVNI